MTLKCLDKISKRCNIEVIVIDNSRNDELEVLVSKYFPNVIYKRNSKNLGFSKANNLGVSFSNSDNLLILNPDTIIADKTIHTAINLLNSDEKIGAVSVKMIDGLGKFLPESCRSFPNFKSSFLKLIGLNSFSSYYNGVQKCNEIEVMSGACMFFKKQVYEKIKGFDERYFMYGEDIDISYQLNKSGYIAKYIGDDAIIHFKGKSSVKSNWKYQNAFYDAMTLYWDKNLNTSKNFFVQLLFSLMIFFLKVFSFLKHSFKLLIFPILDIVGIGFCTSVASFIWSNYVKNDRNFIPLEFYIFILPIYIFVAIFFLMIHRFYDTDFDISSLFKSILYIVVSSWFIYFILPSDYKYSRAIIVYFSLISFFIPFLIRLIYSKVSGTKLRFTNSNLIEGDILGDTKILDRLKSCFSDFSSFKFLLSHKPNQDLIIDVDSIENEEIIRSISNSSYYNSIWFYSDSAHFLIHSHDKNSHGLIIAQDTNYQISEYSSRLIKRVFDIKICFFIVFFGWVFGKKYFTYFRSALRVLFSDNTWIATKSNFPKKSIFTLSDSESDNYLRNYSWRLDLYYLYREMFIS